MSHKIVVPKYNIDTKNLCTNCKYLLVDKVILEEGQDRYICNRPIGGERNNHVELNLVTGEVIDFKPTLLHKVAKEERSIENTVGLTVCGVEAKYFVAKGE